MVIHESLVCSEQLNWALFFRKILHVLQILQFSSIFFIFEPFPAVTVWFWDPSFHTEDNWGTQTQLFKKGSNIHWCSRRKHDALRAGGWKLLNRMTKMSTFFLFCWLCRNFACIVSPLTDLLSGSKSFVWTPECERAFVAAKDILCNAPVLFAPNFDLPFKLQLDVSATGAGAVQIQEDVEGVEHPVSYYSNYSTIEKEALALLLALQHFEVYVGGNSTPVVVYSDHNPLMPECTTLTNDALGVNNSGVQSRHSTSKRFR